MARPVKIPRSYNSDVRGMLILKERIEKDNRYTVEEKAMLGDLIEKLVRKLMEERKCATL